MRGLLPLLGKALSAANLFKGHFPLTDGAGLLPLHPLVDAGKMEVMVALCPYCWILCKHTLYVTHDALPMLDSAVSAVLKSLYSLTEVQHTLIHGNAENVKKVSPSWINPH